MPPTIESAPWRGVFTTRPHSKKPHPQPNAKMPPPTHSSPSNHSEPQKQPPIHKNTTRLKYVRYGMMVFALVVSLVGIWRYRAVMDDLETFQRAQATIHKLSQPLIKPPPKIWLVWTTAQDTFRERNLKVIDTYLYQHPDAEINIFASYLTTNPFQRHIEAGYKINVIPLTDELLISWTKPGADSDAPACPGASWMENLSGWQKGPYYYSHITDFIRFCVLYRYGGVYSDFDALLLQKVNEYDTFIGKDSSGALGKCSWCLAGGDLYLAPGLMASKAGHAFPYNALKIGFEEQTYQPEIFNLVGPMAVTKAFKRNPRNIHVYDRHAFYPFAWNKANLTFVPVSDTKARLDRLRRRSHSLHFYGHATKHDTVQTGSIVDAVFREFSVIADEPVGRYSLRAPKVLGITKEAEVVEDLKIVVPKVLSVDTDGAVFTVSLSSSRGKFLLMNEGDEQTYPQSTLSLSSTSIQKLNTQLSRIIYLSDNMNDKRDIITTTFTTHHHTFRQPPQTTKTKVYSITSLLTIIVKTVGRMEKVFNLLESARKAYPNVKVIVSDDAEHIFQQEGMYRGFYYLPLPKDVGLSAGRNQMVSKVDTEYFLTLDDDFKFDETSRLEDLVHVLEETGFDIAAGKNPVDEAKFELDFCGFLNVEDAGKTLVLTEGSYGNYFGCNHVDFVPNIFVGRTEVFRTKISWDESLKLGEHEDFFLRAKSVGIRTLTCPAVSFVHDQVPHWLKRTKYDHMRSRVYDFWKMSLKKHGFTKLVSFGRVMMDLNVPPPVESCTATDVFAHGVRLEWHSPVASSFNILYSKDHGYTFHHVYRGEGYMLDENAGRQSIFIDDLQHNRQYVFKIFAGNRFIYEQTGREIKVSTLTLDEETGMNLVMNGNFDVAHRYWQILPGTTYHIVNTTSVSKPFAGRSQITTKSYNSPSTTDTYIYQWIHFQNKQLQNTRQQKVLAPFVSGEKDIQKLIVSGFSKIERFFGGEVLWQIEVNVNFNDDHPPMRFVEEFDAGNHDRWQGREFDICFAPGVAKQIRRVDVAARFSAFRGSVYWDDFVVIPVAY